MSTISIIIPCYNHGRFLADAIDSILCQQYSDVQIIVVDDGSTDDTHAVASSYGAAICYVWQENCGLSAARNHGLRLAQGEMIGFLDADDLHHGPYLATLVSLLDRNPEFGAVTCGFRFVDENKRPLPQVENRVVPPNRLYETLLGGNFLAPECVLARRTCYDAIGPFDETLRAAEDWDMWLRLARRFRVLSIPDVLAWHRVLAGSMSSNPQRMEDNLLTVVRKHVGPETVDPGQLASHQRRAYGSVYFLSALYFLQQGDYAATYSRIKRAITIYPQHLEEDTFFYELAVGRQPKGQRGDFASWSLMDGDLVLLRILGDLFADKDLTECAWRRQRSVVYANAYYALGSLCYGARMIKPARAYFVKSLRCQPSFIVKRSLVTRFVKSVVGGLWLKEKSTVSVGGGRL